jgi:hypothetical protein
MRKQSSALCCIAALGALAAALPARADPTAADMAASEVLFNDARKLVNEGRINDACPKFEESQRLDPTAGTLLSLGDCYQRSSPPRFASAWGAYRDAEAMARSAGDAARQQGAAQLAHAVEPLLSKVTITPTLTARVQGLDVKWDGRSFGAGLWGSALPVDAGEHTIEASAPGKKSWKATVQVPATAGTIYAEVPALADVPAETIRDNSPPPGWWSTQRKIGVAVGGAGVVGTIVGSVFGAMTLIKTGDSKPHCTTTEIIRCDPVGLQLRSEAGTTAKISDVTFAIGGAALVTGIVLIVVGSPAAPAKPPAGLVVQAGPMVGASTAGFLFQGEW